MPYESSRNVSGGRGRVKQSKQTHAAYDFLSSHGHHPAAVHATFIIVSQSLGSPLIIVPFCPTEAGVCATEDRNHQNSISSQPEKIDTGWPVVCFMTPAVLSTTTITQKVRAFCMAHGNPICQRGVCYSLAFRSSMDCATTDVAPCKTLVNEGGPYGFRIA